MLRPLLSRVEEGSLTSTGFTDIAIERGSALADQAYVALRDAILGHRLLPGSRLSVPEVARQLGISRSPAREAIARIAQEGLARLEPNKGAVVAEIAADDLIEIYDLREVLEGLASRLAVARLDQARLAELADLLERHQAAVDADDVDGHMKLDAAFHLAIRQLAGNRRLTESLDRLQGQIRVAMATTRRSPGGMRQALAEHRAIYAALRRGDADAAERAARDHIGRLRQNLQDSVNHQETP